MGQRPNVPEAGKSENVNMGRIKDQLNTIVNPDLAGLNQLYNIFRSVPDRELPIIRFILYPGSSLIRQRINKKGKKFDHLSNLSYPPIAVTPMERANLPGHPMFYACKFPNEISKEAPIPRMIALEETSSFMKDKSQNGIERSTVSRWEITKPIELVALPFIGEYPMACPELKQIKIEWKKALKKGEVPQDALELVNYMAEEISLDFDDADKYFKIANFVYYLMTKCEKTKKTDGILYPSVPSKGSGFNVAIKPETVDEKIRFSNASICHLVKRGTEMHVFTIEDAIVDGYGNITYKERERSDKEISYYQQVSDGLMFIN